MAEMNGYLMHIFLPCVQSGKWKSLGRNELCALKIFFVTDFTSTMKQCESKNTTTQDKRYRQQQKWDGHHRRREYNTFG